MNTYSDWKNLMKHSSVTQFIKNNLKKNLKNFSECDDTKEIYYYVFETKVESFMKNGKTTECSQTARVDKKGKICEIVEKLLKKSKSYLCHKSHVDNILEVIPLILEAFKGKITELDFSENLPLKPNAHFSGKTVSPPLCNSKTWRK